MPRRPLSAAGLGLNPAAERRPRPAAATLPWAQPPLLRFRNEPPIIMPLKYLLGATFTIITILTLFILLPLLFLARFIVYLYKKCRRRSDHVELKHCDLHWPMVGNTPGRAIVFLNKEANPNTVAHKMNKVLSSTLAECCALKTASLSPTRDVVVVWDQSRTRMQGTDELRAVLNEPHGLPSSDCSCVVVPGFGSAPEGNLGQSLLIFSLQPRSQHFCLPRLISLYSQAQLVFEVEPRLTRPIIPAPIPRLVIPLRICKAFYDGINLFCKGPVTLASHAFRREQSVWKATGNEASLRIPVTTSKNRKPTTSSPTESDSTLIHSVNLEEVVVSSPNTDANHKISSMSVPPSSRWVSWFRVGHGDCLSRAERLLRASTVELLTALVTGSLRMYFREQGIKHPPDVGASLCVSRRDFVPVEAARACEGILLPIRLPTSVEGAIPRAWAVQRRMAKVLDGVLPTALKCAHFLGSLAFPASLAERFSSCFYADNAVQISFYRTGGDLSLDGIRMHSLFLFPSVKDSVLASFCFVQSGADLLLSMSLDKNVFPSPNELLNTFKIEVEHVIEQLSMRLLTLSQATFLPGQMPFMRSSSDAEEYCQDSDYFARQQRRVQQPIQESTTSSEIQKDDSEYTLEELQTLLTTVQAELDGMRNNPQGNRADYIRKLSELENRMQRFHKCIIEKLGPDVSDLVQEDPKAASSAVAELLAPYRQETGMTGRRFSREYIRVDSISSIRKGSKHSF